MLTLILIQLQCENGPLSQIITNSLVAPNQAKNREPEAEYAQLDTTGESQSKLMKLELEILGLHAGILTLRNTSKNHPFGEIWLDDCVARDI